MQHGPASAAPNIQYPSPDIPHGPALDGSPVLELSKIELGARSDREVAVITFDDFPGIPPLEVVEHRLAVGVLVSFQLHFSPGPMAAAAELEPSIEAVRPAIPGVAVARRAKGRKNLRMLRGERVVLR